MMGQDGRSKHERISSEEDGTMMALGSNTVIDTSGGWTSVGCSTIM